jgi:aryl carrier-like protein
MKKLTVSQDATFDNMTYEDWDTSIRSKVSSSINLDRLLPRGMDFFIMLSSLSGIVGLKGQANYAAGNTFQDALAHARVQRGERAVALDLGAMSKIGVIAENEHLGHLAKTHMLPVGESEFHALLDHYCFASNLEAQCLVGLPTPEYLHSNGGELPEAYEQPLFSHLRNIGRNEASTASSEDTKKGTTDYARRFKAATSAEEAAAVVVEGLVAKLSHTLSVPVEDIDPTKPLHAYGVDSLVAVELRNWFAKEFASNVAIFNFVGAPCIQAVGGLVTEASSLKWQGQAG